MNTAQRTRPRARTERYGVVRRVEQLSPTMVRVVLGDGDLPRFEPTPYTDQYINGQFLPPDAPYSVPFDRDVATADPAFRPRPRRYTIRRWDDEAKELTLDFVAHGDEGFAGPWAQRARPGDRLQFAGPGGGYAPAADAAWHLFVGDESATPAIAASLERLPDGARCIVRIVVDGPEHELELTTASEADIGWLHRSRADNPELLLPEAVAALDFPPGPVDLFVHGEAGEVRAVRKHLITDRNIDVEGASISPYWRRNHTDERWREVKAAWTAEMKQDG